MSHYLNFLIKFHVEGLPKGSDEIDENSPVRSAIDDSSEGLSNDSKDSPS